ncbi:UNVERIFIED_ORG: hypothetical protein J2X79_004219 [Arthrobacter globiformis]|nr:hypothetical protein [Arthrobacter globiformis]
MYAYKLPLVGWLGPIVAAVATLVVPVAPSPAPAADVVNQHQVVPAYFYPDWYNAGNKWYRMCDRMNTVNGPSTAIMNPNSGPGTKANPDYTKVITYCQAKKQKVVGYVHTSYGARPLSAVKADINRYYTFYPRLNGIFLDEMANDPAKAASGAATTRSYYRQLYLYIKAKTAGVEQVIGNPGGAASTAWQVADPAADIVVVFEGTAAKYELWRPPSWVTARSATRFSHLIYATAPANRQHVCALTRARNAGYFYVTNDVLPNPWNTLPSYWAQEAPTCR